MHNLEDSLPNVNLFNLLSELMAVQIAVRGCLCSLLCASGNLFL